MIVEVKDLLYRYAVPARGRTPASSSSSPSDSPAATRFALHDLSFSVENSGLVALLGPNGSGKSTLFRILTTMIAPGAGTANVFGFDTVKQAARVRGEIGVVFQESSLDRKLTVRENLCFQGNLFGLSGKALGAKVEEIARQLNLADRLDALVHTLSGGLRRRAEIAKALLHRPRLLLLDEPSTGLDPHARRDLWNYLRQLHEEQGTAVIAATHYLEEAEHCHRVIILHEGRLVADGEPSALKRSVGGDVLIVESDHAESMLAALGRRSGMNASALNGTLRIEAANAPEIVTELMGGYADRIRELHMHQPSLEDVYFRATGKEFAS